MDILSQIKNKVIEYENCYREFSEYTVEKKEHTKRWMDALYQNKIIFNGGDTQVYYKDFKQIDFSGPEINNNQWHAQLNRFFWLEPIAWEYERTKDFRLAKLVRDSIEAWLNFRDIDENDLDDKVWRSIPDNTLNASIRLGQFNRRGWWGTVPYLEDSNLFDKSFIELMLKSTEHQLKYIKANNKQTGNWRISELDTLFFAGFCLPGMGGYLDYAVENINETFYTQVHSDGSHEEHTPGYHGWMRNVFTRYCYVQKNLPGLGFDIDPVKLGRMWNYSLYTYAPDKQTIGINDSGRWNENADYNIVNLTYDNFIGNMNMFIYDFSLNNLSEFNTKDKPSKFFDKAGQIIVRNGWDKSSTVFIFDDTVWGGWHSHRARNAVNMYHNGKMLLIDPGILNYERTDPFTDLGKSTQVHNTISVEGMSQTTVDPIVDQYYDDKFLSFIRSNFSGGYEGKDISLAASHKRILIWIKGFGALVNDNVFCYGGLDKFTSKWQTLPGTVSEHPSNLEAYTGFEDVNVLLRACYSNTDITQKIYSGSWEPPAGWISKNASSLTGGEPAPMICYETKDKVPHFEICQLIVPYDGIKKPDISLKTLSYPTCKVIEMENDNVKVIIVSNYLSGRNADRPNQIGNAGEISCDGKTAVLKFVGNKCVYAYVDQCKKLIYKNKYIINQNKWGSHVVTNI